MMKIKQSNKSCDGVNNSTMIFLIPIESNSEFMVSSPVICISNVSIFYFLFNKKIILIGIKIKLMINVLKQLDQQLKGGL